MGSRGSARVRGDGALRRQQIVECYAEGTRIDVLGGALVLVGLVARAAPGDLTREGLVVKALLFYAPALELVRDGPGRRGRVADYADVHAVECPNHLPVQVHLRYACLGREEPAVAHGPVVQRRAEGEYDVRLCEQFQGERRGEAAGDPDAVRVISEEPVRHRARRQYRPHPVGQCLERLASPGHRRPAPRDYRRVARHFEQVRHLDDRAVRRTRRLECRPVGNDARAAVAGRIHEVYRYVEHDGASLDPGSAQRPRGVGGSGFGASDALRDSAHSLGQDPLFDLEVGPEGAWGHVRGEDEQRRAGLGGLCEAGEGIVKPGPW